MLSLVLGILLAVTLLLTSLLQMPGGVRHVAMHRAQMQQQVYDAESALIAYLEGLPDGYFKLPNVERNRLGPWADISAPVGEGRLHVLAGIACDRACNMLRSVATRREIYEGFRQQVNREITLVKTPLALKIKSGNRRFFGRIPSKALWVQDGDLSLDLEGEIPSERFLVEGLAEVRGHAHIDTLRLYAKGALVLRGQIKIDFLEAFSEDRIEISQGVEFSGVAVARYEIAFPNGIGNVRAHFPSFVMSLENFETSLLDSMLVPDFIEGNLKPFLWSLK